MHKVIFIVVRSPDRVDLLTIKYILFLFAMSVLKNLTFNSFLRLVEKLTPEKPTLISLIKTFLKGC